MKDNRPIGVIDSGIGGLTVIREFQKLLPEENIIYFGDNINVPYGNKSEEEIYQLTKRIFEYLIEKDVKLIAVACNTISSILDRHFLDLDLPIVSIIEPAAEYVVRKGLNDIGVMATSFTIESGLYEKLTRRENREINVIPEACPSLAGLIDDGDYTGREIESIVDRHMTSILNKGELKDIILGCTHYPIVMDKFKNRAPHINFINPAYEQVKYIEKLMAAKGMAGDSKNPSFEIYTTGNEEVYLKMIKLLGISKAEEINVIDL